jgi:hypothetical protein
VFAGRNDRSGIAAAQKGQGSFDFAGRFAKRESARYSQDDSDGEGVFCLRRASGWCFGGID